MLGKSQGRRFSFQAIRPKRGKENVCNSQDFLLQCVCVCVCVCALHLRANSQATHQTMETTLHCNRNSSSPWQGYNSTCFCCVTTSLLKFAVLKIYWGGFVQGYRCHEMQAPTSGKIKSLKLTILVLSCLH